MIEVLEMLAEEFVADDNIPKVAPTGFTGVYLEPVKEEVGPFSTGITLKWLFFRPNLDLPPMGTLFFDIVIHDTDQNRQLETLAYILANYPIPLRHGELRGALWRCDELHFIDVQTISKAKLTTKGGADHIIPLTAWAVVKPIAVVSSP